MRLFPAIFLASLLCSSPARAAEISTMPLHQLNAYIETAGDCSEQIIEWNRKYNGKAITGEVARTFYYRAVSYQEWGNCGRPYFKNIFSELQKSWTLYAIGEVTPAELEAKESEMFQLFFATLAAGNRGGELVAHYEQNTAWRLSQLTPSRQFFNCTFFGEQAKCLP